MGSRNIGGGLQDHGVVFTTNEYLTHSLGIMERFWEGLRTCLPQNLKVPKAATGNLDDVGVRIAGTCCRKEQDTRTILHLLFLQCSTFDRRR